MFLTRLTLDPRGREARRDLGDAYQMHRTLTRVFVSDDDATPPRFLWRLDVDPLRWDRPIVLVQSDSPGDWSKLDALPGYLSKPHETKSVGLVQWLVPERPFRFRLIANPTVCRQGKRLGLVGESAQLDWLSRQAGRHGFELVSAMVGASDVLNSRKDGGVIRIQRASFDGVLRIDKPDAFEMAWRQGIGPAKAFGCGLLSLAPA